MSKLVAGLLTLKKEKVLVAVIYLIVGLFMMILVRSVA
jgi:hypothetical protein